MRPDLALLGDVDEAVGDAEHEDRVLPLRADGRALDLLGRPDALVADLVPVEAPALGDHEDAVVVPGDHVLGGVALHADGVPAHADVPIDAVAMNALVVDLVRLVDPDDAAAGAAPGEARAHRLGGHGGAGDASGGPDLRVDGRGERDGQRGGQPGREVGDTNRG